MANKKDYYEVLGVPKGASDADIKKAYRKLAREHHPDMVKDDEKHHAEARFKEINEAYQVLSDPEKKKMYDQFGHAAGGFNPNSGAGAGGYGGFGGAQGQWGPFSYSYTSNGQGNPNIDPFDIFEEFFGFRGFGGQRAPRKGKNLYYELRIDFIDAVKGATKEISGESGRVKINIPQGARNGTELRFSGKGMPAQEEGVPAGDMFITLRVPTPREFQQRAGDNFGVLIDIDIAQAALGDTLEVPVVDETQSSGVGSAKLKVPAGTQPGTQFRVKGKGMPKLRGRGNGDVIVQVNVVVPKRLNRDQKQALEKYKNS